MKRLILLVILLLVLELPCAAGIWVKGNTHCHSTNSDGDVSPVEVAKWYKSHGYSFLFLTDHDKMTDPAECSSVTDSRFIMIGAEEVTTSYNKIELHCNALGISKTIPRPTGSSALDTIINTVGVISDTGAIVQINHPGFHYSDNTIIGKVATGPRAPKGQLLIEVYNHYAGVQRRALVVAALEAVWDSGLSEGAKLYGVAADDAHKYIDLKSGVGTPGGGWIWVNVEKLTAENVLRSIRQGKFYASTGPELAAHSFDGKTVRVKVKPKPGLKYTMSFIGKGGFLLEESQGPVGEYRLTGGPLEKYVRVRVDSSDGNYLWTQPVWPKN